jgi:spore germination protein
LEKGITNRQMVLIMVLVISAFRIMDIPQMAATAMGRSGWIVILLYAVPFSLVAVMATKLNNMFQNMTLFEYGQILLGKVLNWFLCILLMVFYFCVLAYLNVSMSNIITIDLLPQTQPFLTTGLVIALFGFIVYKGTETMARLFELMGAMYLAVMLLHCLLLLTQSEITNILPFYNPNEGSQLIDSLLPFGIIYGGMDLLLMILFTKRNKGAPKVAFFTMLAIAVQFVLITEGSIGILGVNNAMAYKDTFIQAIKLADAPVIERPDILYMTVGLGSMFAVLIAFIHSIVGIITRMFPSAKRGLIVIIICVIDYIATLAAFGIPAYMPLYKNIVPYLSLFFTGVLPVLLYLIASVKKRMGVI